MTENEGEGYEEKEVVEKKVIASSNDLSRSTGLYIIHVPGVSKYIILTRRI